MSSRNIENDDQQQFKHDFLSDPKVYSPDIWDELRIFLAVAKNKSFNAAAAELGVSQPTVSRAVKSLEKSLKQTLTHADQRGITLTPKGEEIAVVSSKLDQSLADLSFHLRKANNTLQGEVTLAATDGISSQWLAPEIARLAISHPGLSVDLRQSLNETDLSANACDLMLSYTESSDPNMFSDMLGHTHYTAFASHTYLDRNGTPDKGNLSEHFFLQADLFKSQQNLWAKWNDMTAKGTISHCSNMAGSYAELARSGAGIAYLANYVTIEEEAVPLDLGVNVSIPFYLIGKKSSAKDPQIALVRETVINTFKKSQWFEKEFILRPSGSRTTTTLKALFA